MHASRQAISAALIGVASSAAHASEPELVYYDVAGNSAAELRRALDANGPIDESGHRVDAYTRWRVSWTYEAVPDANGCALHNVESSLAVTITLPRWSPAPGAPADLVRAWQRYVKALRVHENGHYAHGVSASEDVTALAKAFRMQSDCKTTAQAFKRQALAIVDKYKAADATYDRDTKHGQTQGVTFP
jgi:predicted secreted Zn-dependent protease